MTPKLATTEDEEPTPLDLFADHHHQRAEGKRKAHARPGAREYHLVVIPERVMAVARTLVLDHPFARLAIDETYQRAELKPWINDLADLKRRGGMTPAIDAVHREWEKGDKLWIVDGQQRYWAHWDAQKPITVQVHNCRTLQEEKDLFDVLNDRRRLGTNYVIHNSAGPTAAILREANDDPSHPWYNRIHFKGGAPGGRVAAGSLVAALARFVGASHGAVVSQIASTDKFTEKPGGKTTLAAFVRLLATVYAPPARPTGDMLLAFARAFAETKTKPPLPKPAITRLRHLKLDSVRASTKAERQLLMTRRVVKALAIANPFVLDTL